MADKLIETGVDRLLSIIKESGKISVNEAASKLGVSAAIAGVWGDFLEDEGYISIDHKITNTFFVLKDIDSKMLTKKAKDLEGKKDSAISRAEVEYAKLKKGNSALNTLRDDFEDLKKDISKEFSSVQGNFKQFEKYESFKADLDKKLKQEGEKINSIVKDIQDTISSKKQDLNSFNIQIKKGQEDIAKISEVIGTLKNKETELLEDLKKTEDQVRSIRSDIDKNSKILGESQKRFNILDKWISEHKRYVEEKKKDIVSLEMASKDYKKKAQQIHDDLYKQWKETEKSKGKQKFEDFFQNKASVEKLLKSTENQGKELERQVTALIKSLKAYHVASKDNKKRTKIRQMENRLKAISSANQDYNKNVENLKKKVGASKTKRSKGWSLFK